MAKGEGDGLGDDGNKARLTGWNTQTSRSSLQPSIGDKSKDCQDHLLFIRTSSEKGVQN